MLLFYFFLFYFPLGHGEYTPANFDFHHPFQEKCDQFPEKCVDLAHLVQKSLSQSWESRSEIQRVFIATSKAREKMGHILPHLNINAAHSIASHSSALAIPASFLGFFFPSRWYRWKEERAYAKSEIESFKALLADRALAVELLYNINQSQIWHLRVIEFYMDQARKSIEELIHQRDTLGRRVSAESLSVLENFICKLRYDHTFQDNFLATYPQLAMAVGYEIGEEGFDFILKPIPVTSVKNLPLSKGTDYVKNAVKVSPELEGLRSMIRAARFGKKSNYFEFIDPEAPGDLGYGMDQRIKISRANIAYFKIIYKKTISKIGENIFIQLNLHNDGLRSSWASEDGLATLENIRKSFEDNLRNIEEPFDINNGIRYLEIAYASGIRSVYSFFVYRNAKATLDRYAWQGPIYEIVDDYVKNDIRPLYNKVRNSHRHRFYPFSLL